MNSVRLGLFRTFFICFVVSCFLPLEAGECKQVKVVNDTEVRIDSTPLSISIGEIRQGVVLECLAEKYGWYKIQLPDKFRGYVSSAYLDNNGYCNAVALNIRSGPTLESPIIGKIKKGEKAEILSRIKEWYVINAYPYSKAWVYKTNIREVEGIKPKKVLKTQVKPEEKGVVNRLTLQKKEKQENGAGRKTEKKKSFNGNNPLAVGVLTTAYRLFCPANYKLLTEKGAILLSIKYPDNKARRYLNKKVAVWGLPKRRRCNFIKVNRIEKIKQ